MDKITNKLIKEVDNLISKGKELIEYGKNNEGDMEDDKIIEFTSWTTRTGELLSLIYPNRENQYHMQYNLCREKIRMDKLHSFNYGVLLEIIGILYAIKYELENGLLDKMKSLLQAEIFADFLEMSEYLLKREYKDAAAVIIGSVLEATLRKFAETNQIKIISDNGKYLTIESLNVELEKAGLYNQLKKKQISSWADLRNNAAHGRFKEYDKTQVEGMLQFVKLFCSENLK